VAASYEFEIGPPARRGLRSFEVVQEKCALRWQGDIWQFGAERGEVKDTMRGAPLANIEADRLYLPVASAQTTFAPLFSRLRGMQFYNFDLDTLRLPQLQTVGSVLGPRGSHLGDVLEALGNDSRGSKERIDAYLRAVVPEITGIDRYIAGSYITVALRARTGANGEEVEFGPEAVSDGTMRAVGVLAALFQPWVLDERVPLVAIEEPEIALHPGTAGVLFDALTEASERVQVVATSQSADLLDREDLDVSSVRAVAMQNGLTTIGEVDEVSKRIVREKLYTVGELMRTNQLSPQPPSEDDATPKRS
jgi:predicted ATPase